MSNLSKQQEFIKSTFVRISAFKNLTDGTLGTNSVNLCKLCKDEPQKCMGHPGFIELHDYVVNPLFISNITNILIRMCWSCDTRFDAELGGISPDDDDFARKVAIYISKNNIKCITCNSNIRYNVKWTEKYNGFESKNVDTGDTELLSARDLLEIPEISDYVIKYVPIFPIYNSDIESPQNRRLIATMGRLLDINSSCFTNLARLVGTKKDAYFPGIPTILRGKWGLIEQTLLGKRINHCLRSVITPDPLLNIDEVSVPASCLEELGVSEGATVLINRQPSLSRHSILAVKIVARNDDTKVMSFNPCLCEGFNADFDGDEMNLFAIIENPDCEELNRMSPLDNIYDIDGAVVIRPHQDCLLGLSFVEPFAEDTKNKVTEYIKKFTTKENFNATIKGMQEAAYEELNDKKFSLTNFEQSIKRIVNSGARGSTSNLAFIRDVNKPEDLERGLSFDSYYEHMVPTRESICNIGTKTSASGHISKKLSSLLSIMKLDDDNITVDGVVISDNIIPRP